MFISDGNGSLINSQKFDVGTRTLHSPSILLRGETDRPRIWEVTGRINAEKAVYNEQTGKWDLTGGVLEQIGSREPPKPVGTFISDLKAKDIPVRRRSEHKTLLSLRDLTALEKQKTQIRDMAQLSSQKHFRITDPIINLVMLMVSLPLLVCRDPKSMKSAVMVSFALTGACFVTTFVCKILATEMMFDRIMPELWAWLPVFIFLPVAFIELDSMKT
jgi:lipopolysaccharide export LptBFGC system permease protein LptF